MNIHLHVFVDASKVVNHKILFKRLLKRDSPAPLTHFLLPGTYSENSLGTVVILPLICSGLLQLTFSDLKQVILDQVRQSGYQTVPFSVYIHNLMFVFHLG